jgi:hypothetical protein
MSLGDQVRQTVLALDIEPGLIDAYQGEDLFMDAHRALVREGFWLSNLNIGGAARIRSSTLSELIPNPALRRMFAHRRMKPSPAWAEARYLRDLNATTDRQGHALLWTFAMLDRQAGFALDVALEYEKRFGRDALSEVMTNRSRRSLRLPAWYAVAAGIKRMLFPSKIDRA